MFNGELLRVIRHANDMNQRELAELVAVSPASISLYENNKREPDAEIVAALGDVLGVLPSFFESEGGELAEEQCNFRSHSTAPVRIQNRMISRVTLLSRWVQQIREVVRLPAFDLPLLPATTPEEIEAAADQCRDHWGYGFGPIRHTLRVLENAGVIVARIDDDAVQIDAFSHFTADSGIVALSTAKGSASRAIFDALHELAHGALHRGVNRKSRKQAEAEANHFAGAFLLPRRSFPREFWAAGGTSLGHLVELKKRWGVSISAMIYRAHQLDLINTAQYRRWMKNISRHGWRSGVQEPSEPEMPTPELLPAASDRYMELAGISVEEAAHQMGWGVELFLEITGISRPETASPTTQLHSLDEYRTRRAVSD